MSTGLSDRDAGKRLNLRLHQRSASARKAAVGVKLPVIASARRSLEDPQDMFEAFKTCEERTKVARVKTEQMLCDKYIHSSVKELKFKADIPNLSQALADVDTARHAKLRPISGLEQLAQQLKKSQQELVKADQVGVWHLADLDKDALNSMLQETPPAKKKIRTQLSSLPPLLRRNITA